MSTRGKQERIIEAVRLNLEGDAAVEFVCKSGYAMTNVGLSRHLRLMGGRQCIQALLQEGKTNTEVLLTCFPDEDPVNLPQSTPAQQDLFGEPQRDHFNLALPPSEVPLYDTTKLTLRIPTDLYEAVRIAARAENIPQSQLIIEILTAALARLPESRSSQEASSNDA